MAKDVVTEKFILGMRIVMLGFEHALRTVNRKPDAEGMTLDDVIDDMRQVLARAAASTVLALAENLQSLSMRPRSRMTPYQKPEPGRPCQCEFIEQCWTSLPFDWVGKLPRVTKGLLDQFAAAEVQSIAEIPETFALTGQ